MSLESDTMNGHFSINKALQQFEDTVSLFRPLRVVVIVKEQSIGIGFMGILKSFDDKIFTTDLIPGRITKELRAVIGNSFVDNIPRIDLSLVAGHDLGNMIF